MDDNPDQYGEALEASPDPTTIHPPEIAYQRGHRAARAVLETIGLPGDPYGGNYSGESAERLVSLILGAALLELERPWRRRFAILEEQAERLDHDAQVARSESEHLRGQRDRAETVADSIHHQILELSARLGPAVLEAPKPTARALRDVAAERARQVVDLGWSREHDVERGPGHVLGYALERIERSGPEPEREELVEAAALILAAIEVVDATGRTDR